MIHQNTIKLADFGNSYLQDSEFYTEACGVELYLDPKIYEGVPYTLTEKSDIYSLGMILQEFWELTKCGKFVKLYQSKYKTIV